MIQSKVSNPCNTTERIEYIRRAWEVDDVFIEDIVYVVNQMPPNPDAKEEVRAAHIRHVVERLRLHRSANFLKLVRMRPKNANFTMEINEVQTKIPDIRTRDGAASVATRLIVEDLSAAKAPVRMEPEDIVGWWQKWCKNRTILSPAEVAQVTKRKDAAKVIDEVNRERERSGLPTYAIAG